MRTDALSGLLLAATMVGGHSALAATFPADSQWIAVTQGGAGLGDSTTDGQNNSREVVGSPEQPAIYMYGDGAYLFVRLRLDSSPLQGGDLRPYGWGILLDTDGDLADYELSLIVNGVAHPPSIDLASNTSPTGNSDPTVQAATLLQTYAWDTSAGGNGRVVPADSSFNGNADTFLDFAIPLAALEAAGVTASTPLRVVAGTSSNGRSLTTDITGSSASPGPGTFASAASDPVLSDGSPAAGECPNGVVGAGEGCDDGNDAGEDGCSPTCSVEPGWACHGSPSVCRTDSDADGIADDGDGSGVAGDHPCTGGATLDCDDNCPSIKNPSQADANGNTTGDACDADADSDGVPNDGDGSGATGDHLCSGGETTGCDDNCAAVVNPAQTDLDGDGIGDACDPDRDGDGLGNDVEAALGLDPDNRDSDSDGVGDGEADADGDGISNVVETNGGVIAVDSDGDGAIDALDTDSDGDGAPDRVEGVGDVDGNGIGNWRDPGTQMADSDGDGVGDTEDNCPEQANPDQKDFDHDGIGNACADKNGDGFADNLSAGGGGVTSCAGTEARSGCILAAALLLLCLRRRARPLTAEPVRIPIDPH